ncbi:hypothetical protein HY375_01680 [Candidatus Berkelbacteria bacterium]|nr:hypothetical protein [Candidatus Berkelbacteria bacterium]
MAQQTYFCLECKQETALRSCELCGEQTEALNVKDDPLLGQSTNGLAYSTGHEDDLYL